MNEGNEEEDDESATISTPAQPQLPEPSDSEPGPSSSQSDQNESTINIGFSPNPSNMKMMLKHRIRLSDTLNHSNYRSSSTGCISAEDARPISTVLWSRSSASYNHHSDQCAINWRTNDQSAKVL